MFSCHDIAEKTKTAYVAPTSCMSITGCISA